MQTMTVSAYRPETAAVIPGYTFVKFEYIDEKDAAERRIRGFATIECTPGWHSVYERQTAAK